MLTSRYGDPGFHRHVDAAKILGLLCMSLSSIWDPADESALRAADSLVLPLNTTQYAIELQYYLEKYVIYLQTELMVQSSEYRRFPFLETRRVAQHVEPIPVYPATNQRIRNPRSPDRE
jgi:hypothetical protein